MPINHAVAASMHGMRSAGDLVARVQMAKTMRIDDAKKYVADKLKMSVADIVDPAIMREVRSELKIGEVNDRPETPYPLAAKARIAELLDIKIKSVDLYNDWAKL
jgi:dimethylamine--corrinoid protein Co-methyltransferase